MTDPKRIRCSMARKKGTRMEYELLKALKDTYPTLAHAFIKGEYHDLYDIYSPFCNLDMVSVDSKHRIITDHKNFCKEHIKYEKQTGIPGFICFIFGNEYKYLPVHARILKRVARPTIDGYVLNQCKPLPIDSYFSSIRATKGIAYIYLELQGNKNVSTHTNNIEEPQKEKEVIKNYSDVIPPLRKYEPKHKKISIDPNVIHRRNLSLFCHQ